MDESTRTIGNSFGITSFGGIGVVSVLILLLALVAILPAPSRPKARLPFALVLLHFLFIWLGSAMPQAAVAERPVSVVATFLLLAAAARVVFLLVVEGIFAGRLRRPLPKILRQILQAVVFLLVVMATLHAAGVEPGSLLTTSALLTAVVGLSLQDTLGNLFSGLSIQAQTPFEVGDWIGFDAEPKNVGRVIEINWRATKVITHEEVEIIIPNGALAKAPIRNFSKPSPFTRRSVDVGCDYDVSPARVRAVILAALAGTTDVLTDPPAIVEVHGFGASSIDYQVHFYVSNFARRFAIGSAARERIWYALRRARISIPYPTREIHTFVSTDEARSAAAAKERREHVELLRRVDFLQVLPEAAVDELAGLTETRVYGAGESVLEEGDAGDELFVVVSGTVSIIVGRARSSIAEVSRLGPGQFFGEMSLMTGDKRSATAKAVTETELLVVGKAAFSQILAHAPELAEKVAVVLTHRRVELDEHLAERARRAKPEQDADAIALVQRVKQFFHL
ncbi:MAG: cyclic nucleotide-binding domain-containing protein [Polyangiaceae bacterium]